MHALVHVNPGIAWQKKYAVALVQGLVENGHKASTTSDPTRRSDLTILLGPHWAKPYHEDGLLIDRAYWGDPDNVSIHWLFKGEKVYDWRARDGRAMPDLKPMKSGNKTVVLCDYQRYFYFDGATIRKHPTEEKPTETLQECLDRHDIAVGGMSTAMVDAAINGLSVITEDEYSPVYPLMESSNRESWLKALSWHNWSINEIQSGTLWRHWL